MGWNSYGYAQGAANTENRRSSRNDEIVNITFGFGLPCSSSHIPLICQRQSSQLKAAFPFPISCPVVGSEQERRCISLGRLVQVEACQQSKVVESEGCLQNNTRKGWKEHTCLPVLSVFAVAWLIVMVKGANLGVTVYNATTFRLAVYNTTAQFTIPRVSPLLCNIRRIHRRWAIHALLYVIIAIQTIRDDGPKCERSIRVHRRFQASFAELDNYRKVRIPVVF
jgi:hypothetical protein